MWEWENVCKFNANTVPAYLFVKGPGTNPFSGIERRLY